MDLSEHRNPRSAVTLAPRSSFLPPRLIPAYSSYFLNPWKGKHGRTTCQLVCLGFLLKCHKRMWLIQSCFTIMQLNSFPKQEPYGPAGPKPEQVIFPRLRNTDKWCWSESLFKECLQGKRQTTRIFFYLKLVMND